MEGVEDLVANSGEACTDHLGSLFLEDAYHFAQREVLISSSYQAQVYPRVPLPQLDYGQFCSRFRTAAFDVVAVWPPGSCSQLLPPRQRIYSVLQFLDIASRQIKPI